MHAVVHGERTLTDVDFARLTKLLSQQLPPTLADLLASAEVMRSRAVNADVITMYSRVEVVDAHTRRRQVLTICYPDDAEPAAGCISVLSPVGISLLGLKAGDVAKWLTPTGEECAAEITAIQYQPEAAGDYSR
ncbi:GreA/GreB family elongation factor [Variovorax sp. J22R24]|uniref:GreA/GreB family elongation factor n=1 Tax=Variovorax gracilis TaxID=3053502 RepID=UPI0025765DD1|nr:GreA/GreB family elongation factor [Variovorax sp. J22R24]MDM0110091.1 GreA/GreB family elongation factor [Variovorax sp. J22R24]